MIAVDVERLAKSCNNHIAFNAAGPQTFRIMVPFFHEDGDMYDIFLRIIGDTLQICDFGATLMRLSYKTDLDTENKVNIFLKIVADNGVAYTRPEPVRSSLPSCCT